MTTAATPTRTPIKPNEIVQALESKLNPFFGRERVEIIDGKNHYVVNELKDGYFNVEQFDNDGEAIKDGVTWLPCDAHYLGLVLHTYAIMGGTQLKT